MAVPNTSRLKAAGPINPENGFPLWFEDMNGVRLELGLNPDPRTPAVGDLPQPGAPLKFPENFPDESFYFLAEARLDVGGNGVQGRARVILALEAAFGGAGTPKKGLNVVFARIRVRMDDLIPGTKYKVTHPYGMIDFDELEADERGRVFYTEDLGIVEGDPTAVLLNGKVAPFLIGTSPLPLPDDNYIGDGVTEQQVKGSPSDINTNFVRIEGPRIGEFGGNPDPNDSSNLDKVWTDRFTVQGRKANRVGAWVDSTTYAKSTDGSNRFLLSVQARSIAGQDLRLVATGVHFTLDDEGEFYTGLGQATTLPSDARLVNVSDSPPTSYPVTFADLVLVESALYDRATQTLTIKARSSDPNNAVLTLPQLSDLPLTSSPQSFNRDAVPAEIIVSSSLGGEGRQRVEVVNVPKVNLPVEAIVAPPPEAIAAEQVTLDGSGSLGATSFTWSQNNLPPVPLAGATTAKATFIPPTAGSYTFRLSVQGGDGSSDNADITVIVKPTPGPDTLEMTRQEYRTSARQFRIEGTVGINQLPNEIVVTFRGEELGRSMADITGAWSVRLTLLASQTRLIPQLGDTVEVRSKRGSVNPPPVIRIRN